MTALSEAMTAAVQNDEDNTEKIMNEWIHKVQADLPKIEQSVKNLLAVLLAKRPPTPQSPAEEVNEYLAPPKALGCAKLFLKALQAFPLLEIDEFCRAFPQSPSQSASARLDEVCRYKAVLALREHAVRSGGKVSRVFGRDFFLASRQWAALRESARAKWEDCDNTTKSVSLEELEVFLTLYERSIFASAENPQEADQDLVWSNNFNASLRERQLARAKAVNERVQQANERAASELTEIVDAVRGEEQDDEP